MSDYCLKLASMQISDHDILINASSISSIFVIMNAGLSSMRPKVKLPARYYFNTMDEILPHNRCLWLCLY